MRGTKDLNFRNEARKPAAVPFVKAAGAAAGVLLVHNIFSGCGNSSVDTPLNPVSPVDTTTHQDTTGRDTSRVDTTGSRVSDTITVYNGPLGTPLACWVPNGPACIWNGNVKLFGDLPIKFLAADSSNSARLQLARQNGKLFKQLTAVSGLDTTIDLGLETVNVRVDTVSADSSAKYAKVTVTKICDGAEVCAPTLWLDCGAGSKMTSPCIPLGTVYAFGEYSVRLDAVDISTPTKLKVIVSVLRYDCSVARRDTIAELATDTMDIGTHKIYVKADDIHATLLPDPVDTTGVTSVLGKRLDQVNSCAVLSVSKDCPK